MKKLLTKNGIEIEGELEKKGLADTHWKLPFVYVYERNDFSVSYYAFNVYPGIIRKSLLSRRLQEDLTGKFTMYVDYTRKGVQHLYIVIEKSSKSKMNAKKLKKKAVESIHERLLRESTEYPEVFRMMGAIVKPVILLRPYEDPEYFKPGVKQKWVLK